MNEFTNSQTQIRSVRIIYVATIVFLALLSVYTFNKTKAMTDYSKSMDQSNAIKQSLQKITNSVLEAETNKRAFLLTSIDHLLAKRDSALSELTDERMMLYSLLADRPEQTINLQNLNKALDKKIANILLSNLRSQEAFMLDSLDVNITEGIKTMAEVKYHVSMISITEAQLMNYELRENTFLSYITPFYVIVLFLGALFILFISYFRINGALRESKEMQSQLMTLNQTFAFAEEIGNYASYRYSFNTKKTQNSDNLYRMLGLNPQEISEFETLAKFVHPDDLAYFNEAVRLVTEEKKLSKWEYRVLRKDGSIMHILATGKIIYDQGMEWLIGTLQDVSEQKVQQQALSTKNAQLNSKNTELEKMNNELELFAHISSHDLQEPLRKIQTFASMIQEKEYNSLSANAKEYFTRLQDSAGRMQELVEDLLNFSQTNNSERNFELTKVNSIIQEVQEELKDVISEKKATLRIQGDCELKIIPLQFRQMIFNLIGNALKFSRPDVTPLIAITNQIESGKMLNHSTAIAQSGQSLRMDQEYYHLEISDNGIGFSPEYRTKIFDVFHRLHTKEKYKGTGVGLAIVKRIVENHNGYIFANGEPNQGASFNIFIPTT